MTNEHEHMKHSKCIKHPKYEKLLIGFIIFSILALLGLLALMYGHDKANALVFARETTSFLENACDRYDNTQLDYSSIASEILRETADTLVDCSSTSQIQDTDYLSEFASSQKISGVIILNEDLSLITQINTDSENGYQLFHNLIVQANKNNIAAYPEKSYVAQVTLDGNDYAIAMRSRTDVPGIVVCYTRIQRESTDHYAYSFTSILENNTFHKNPTIVITDGKQILASNAKGLKELTTFQDQTSETWNRTWNASELIRLSAGYQSWYGTRTVYGKYHIFVFCPSNELFSNVPVVLAFSIAGIVLLFLLLILYRQHAERKTMQQEEKQLETIRSIGTLFSSAMLLHLDSMQMEKIFASEQVASLVDGKKDALEITNLVIESLVDPQYHESIREFLNPKTFQERIDARDHLGFILQDIHENWYSIYVITNHYNKDGKLTSVLLASRDVTDYKVQEEATRNELRKIARDADMANAVKTTFLRRMSHDVRTPINGIQGMTEIARKNLDNPETVKECLDKITSSSSYLLDLVNDVLRMSKLESGNILLEEKPFYFRQVLMDTASFIEVQAQQKSVHFSASCRHDSEKLLLGSPLHVRQILQNIMSNAVKYTPEGGTVTVTSQEMLLTDTNATYEIFCTDTGIGMSKEFQEHAFEPFVQEDDSARTTFTGVGLGLSIVKDLVDRMNGKIRFTSEQGKGTTFVITLTFRLDPSCLKKADFEPSVSDFDKDTSKADLSLEGLRILVAEDNEINMEITKYLLAEHGAHVKEARNGQEALDLFQLSNPGTYDIILMDIMMPVMDGLESSRRIRALRRTDAKTVPIFAMTANAFVEDEHQSAEAGMNEHLTKPLNIEELVQMIRKYCHKIS